ncbi:MAG TPA: DUF3820 family protein [Gammaproteobacteria bacterium]|nr:DUF3820 family protein [Gammaproteobacteria bacterium]
MPTAKKIDDDFSSVTMPAGDYIGQTMEDLPTWYLEWVAGNWRDDRIATAADQELKWRQQYGD